MYRYRWYPPFVGTTEVIGSGAITEEKIAPNAVTSPKILDRTIVADDIADAAIRLRHLGPDIPSIGVIPDNSITTPKILDGAVTGPKIGPLAVISTKIGAGSVLEDKIATNAVTETKIKNGAVTLPKLAPGMGVYVPRRINSADFTQANFVQDGTPYINGLDLSGIVPAGAIAVALRMSILSDMSMYVPRLSLWTDRTNYFYTFLEVGAQYEIAEGIETYGRACGILPIDADRKLDYAADGPPGSPAILVTVLGWFI